MATLKRRVRFDQQIHGRANGVAHRADDIYSEIEIVARKIPPAGAERIEFERRVSARGDHLGLRREALRRARAAIPAVGVRAQFFVALTAPEIVDRLIAGLADDVPERDFDSRHGAHMHLRAVGVHIADEALRDGLHLEGVHADDQRLQLVDGGLHGPGEVIRRAFAHAVDAFVGGHLGEQPVLPGIAGDVGVDRCDSHVGDVILHQN